MAAEHTVTWNITEKGANEIAAMRKRLGVKASMVESSYKRLLGASVEYGEGLGIYGDVVQAELEIIGILSGECRESVDELCFRLEQYENIIRQQCAKEKEEAAETAGSTGGHKNARR